MFLLVCPDAGCVVCRATRGPRAPRGATSSYTATPLRDWIGKYFSTHFIVAPFIYYVDHYITLYYTSHLTAKFLTYYKRERKIHLTLSWYNLQRVYGPKKYTSHFPSKKLMQEKNTQNAIILKPL